VPAGEPGGANLNGMIALSVAIIATFIALCNVKAGNIKQSMSQAQAKSVRQTTKTELDGVECMVLPYVRALLPRLTLPDRLA